VALLKPGSRSPFTERNFTGCVFGDVLFQFFTPQGLKCPATAIQRIHSGKVGMSALQITKVDFAGRHACVFSHLIEHRFCNIIAFRTKRSSKKRNGFSF
jgi:hypothetical protein